MKIAVIGTGIAGNVAARQLCKEHEINTIISHRSGETEDTFIVDLAIGASAGQLKAGHSLRKLEGYRP